jgi:hypothetical protein
MDAKFKINKTQGEEYLQIWNNGKCVSVGTARKLVRIIMDENQTKILREKLTKIYEEKSPVKTKTPVCAK